MKVIKSTDSCHVLQHDGEKYRRWDLDGEISWEYDDPDSAYWREIYGDVDPRFDTLEATFQADVC